MIELITKINQIYEMMKDLKKQYDEEIRKKDIIIKSQQNYIKDLEKFIDEWK